MILSDTHTHLYLEEFSEDRDEAIQRAFDKGIRYMLLPNINSQSAGPMLELCERYPQHLFPMMGLHPTDVKDDYEKELEMVEHWLEQRKFYAIGEIGIDLYWDKSFAAQQEIALRHQIGLAKKYQLPLVLHVRDSFDEIFRILDDTIDEQLKGVFHCFTGNPNQAKKIMEWGFMMGIGGVLTFKNAGLDKVVKDIPLQYLLLETDSPFLAPKPFRGKRNESAYLIHVAEKLAQIKDLSIDEIATTTTHNAASLFNFPMNTTNTI